MKKNTFLLRSLTFHLKCSVVRLTALDFISWSQLIHAYMPLSPKAPVSSLVPGVHTQWPLRRRFHTCIESRFLNELIFVSPSYNMYSFMYIPHFIKMSHWSVWYNSRHLTSFLYLYVNYLCHLSSDKFLHAWAEHASNRERGFSFPMPAGIIMRC